MIADVVVIGAGPAGLSLAIGLARAGARVEIVDEQPAPGGQIYRASESNAAGTAPGRWLGPDYAEGAGLVEAARQTAGIGWHLNSTVWDIRPEADRCELGLRRDGRASVIAARHVVLATGAMERPTPFLGWTLPGVMGLGATQTLMKDAGLLPVDGVVLAGQGPLLYLYAAQILAAGVRPAAVLDCAPRWAALADLPLLTHAALGTAGSLAKGLSLRAEISRAGVPHVYGVGQIEASGADKVTRVAYWRKGARQTIDTDLLLVHDGVIPNTHLSMAAGCAHDWDADQAAWVPRRDPQGRSSQDRVWVLGDGARIMGAQAATIQGRIMARALASELGLPPPDDMSVDRADRAALRRLGPLRRFLDRHYTTSPAFVAPPDEVPICRCEAVTAGDIRNLARMGCMGPNQLRAFSRAGMGPCMGRQCGTAISRIMAAETGRSVAEIGCFSIRAPVKPITVAELARLSDDRP